MEVLGRLARSFPPALRRFGGIRLQSGHARPNVLAELQERGFVAALTSPSIEQLLQGRTCIYSGVDPSASSLHVGNLLPLLVLLHLKRSGHDVLALIGGATGAIGDPSGRSTERNALNLSTLAHNVSAITAQVRTFFERGDRYIDAKVGQEANARCPSEASQARGSLQIVNNHDWHSGLSFLDFLRDVGKYARVNTMLARDSVKNRLSTDQGISFTEFSYQLLQAYDFEYLLNTHGCKVQVGGSDQWGNIVAGIDLIKRKSGIAPVQSGGEVTVGEADAGPPDTATAEREEAFGLTIPLLTTSSGEKFGKSAGNAVWLDKTRTGVYDFYQYFLRTPDADTAKLLRLFTFLPMDRIEGLMAEGKAKPESRLPQRILAEEVTELVHGPEAVTQAQTASRILFDTSLTDLSADAVMKAFQHDARLKVVQQAEFVNMPLTKLAATYGLAKSRGEAIRLAKSGGLYLNNEKVVDLDRLIKSQDMLDDRFIVLGAGKSQRIVLMAD